MPWTFSNNKLNSPFGQSWPAKSGPYGQGRLQVGSYKIGKVTSLASANSNKSFTDKKGFAWWCPITPNFLTNRKNLGIHPDGGVSGTEGCIGLTSGDTKSAYNALKSANGETLMVQ